MAQNVIINGVTYQAVPEVNIPLSGGGTAVFYDTSDANISANHIVSGKTAYGVNGAVVGNLTMPTVSQDAVTKVLSIS